MKKRQRRCKHKSARVFVYREKVHECRECEFRTYAKRKYREDNPLCLGFITFCRTRWNHVPGPCSWPQNCGKMVVVPGCFYVKCTECELMGDQKKSPRSAMRSFSSAVVVARR